MWRPITSDDIAATLSQAELEAYRRSAADSGDDPVPALLARTAEMVRGYIRANKAVRLSPDAAAIPDSLISPACDYAAYDVIKRMPVAMKEPRQRARDDALALFRDVASGDFTPESFAVEGEEPANPRQSPSHTSSQLTLG